MNYFKEKYVPTMAINIPIMVEVCLHKDKGVNLKNKYQDKGKDNLK